MSDHAAFKLQLDLLLAEANLHADKVVRQLLEENLTAALTTAADWKVVQDEISQLLEDGGK